MLELSTPNVFFCMGHLHARLRTNNHGRQCPQGTIFFSRMTPAKWSGHERHRLCYNCSKKKHYDCPSFTLFYEIMYFLKCLLIILLTFTYVLLKCTESQYIVVLELGNVAWLHVYSQLHRVVGEYESGQSVWSFYSKTLKPWLSRNFIKWSDLQFYINVVK